MQEYRSKLISLAWRLLFAAPLFLICVMGYAGFASPLFGVVGAIIVAGPLAGILAERSGNLFYPSASFSRAQPLYSVAEAKRARGFYEEAIAKYEEIAEKYPDEVKPYIQMIEIVVVDLKDKDRAAQVLYKAIADLKNEEDKNKVKKIYEATLTRLDPMLEWQKEQQEKVLTAPDLKDQGPVHEPDGRKVRRFHAGAEGQYEGS